MFTNYRKLESCIKPNGRELAIYAVDGMIGTHYAVYDETILLARYSEHILAKVVYDIQRNV